MTILGITFSANIDLGYVIVSFIMFASLILTLRNDVKGLKINMASVNTELKKLTDVMVSIARQDERLSAMDKRIDDMVHRGKQLDAA